MNCVSRRIEKMAGDAKHGPQHLNSFCQRTHIHCRRRKLPTPMSKPNSTLWHPSHWLEVYNFRFHSQITHTYTTNIFHSHITQIWKIIYGQWIHLSKLKHVGEALDKYTKELILDTKITDEHGCVQDTLPYPYNPYLSTPLYTILYN